MLRRRLNQAGETIIEVLLALAILGLVLGIAYASASRSLRGSQDAQERTEASQLAQSLLEVTTQYAKHSNDPAITTKIFPTGTGSICLKTDIDSIENSSDPDRIIDKDLDNPICQRGIYKVWVDINNIPSGGLDAYEYTATVEWENIVSGDNAQAIMRYKWYRITP